MDSSDDEGEIIAKAVTEYYFEDSSEEPISFAKLPVHWNDGEITGGEVVQIFLRGKVDNGLHKIFEPIAAWKIDFSFNKPEMLVLSAKDKNWIKLLKPRKSFEQTIRTILITVHCLHFLKNNPRASKKFLWDHLAKTFSVYENKPSLNDLVDHRPLIIEAIKREENLKKSEVLLEMVKENPRRSRIANEGTRSPPVSGFIVDDLEDTIDETKDASDEEEETYDSVCAFCDNGGNLLCCEGRCIRSFHATVGAGSDSRCRSLGLRQEEVDAIPNYLCKNCEYQQHQCYSCGKLGSSDRSIRAEVFKCASATCGYFYHPQCVAKWLHGEDQVAVKDLMENFFSGETFLCPIHKCRNCNKGEVKTDRELQLAVCRRCPTAYHRKCLPRKISFEDDEDKGLKARAWEGLLLNRILIYCLKHEINEELDTPDRDHIKFPGDENSKKNQAELHKKQSGNFKKPMLASAVPPRIPMRARKLIKPPNSAPRAGDCSKKTEKISSGSVLVKKGKSTGASGKSVQDDGHYVSEKVGKISHTDINRASLGKRLFHHRSKLKRQYIGDNEQERTVSTKPALKKLEQLSLELDNESKNRISNLIDECASSITLEDIVKKHKGPATHVGQCKEDVDKIKQGKVEGAVEALRTALLKLDAGCSIDDAKAVCEPSVLHNVYVWKDKLKVYLAPFIHGMRYTSFGRHFTKVDKLEKIAEKLLVYVANGDTIVDFCCGANDFSCILKTKLDKTGKKCLYRNYDILQAKNDFNFEKRDWMTVQPNELPTGSQLIMGLNPPFGYKSSLANKFIDKALKFKPKLLILIVPPQAERLDAKEKMQGSYDLIWEDKNLLSGKSFYLPGSVDENDKQINQWNNITPPLYLWSRSDWTARHMKIAQKHGHVEENNFRTQNLNPPLEDDDGFSDLSMLLDDHLMQIDEPNERESGRVASQYSNKNCSSNTRKRRRKNHSRAKNDSQQNYRRQHGSENSREETGEVSVGDSQNGRRLSMNDWDLRRPSPHCATNDIPSLQDHPSHNVPSASGFGEDQQRFRSHLPTSSLQRGTSYDGTGTNYFNDMARRHGLDNDPSYTTGTPGYSQHIYRNHTLGYDERPNQSGAPGYDEHHYQSGTAGFSGHSYPSRIPGYIEQRPHTGGTAGWPSGAASSIDNFGLQSLVHQYGREEPDPRTQRGSYLSGHEPAAFGQRSPLPPAYVDHGLGVDQSYGRMNRSTMQRYAPLPDEMNPRMSPMGSQPPIGNRNEMNDYAQPRPRAGSFGFAYGPPHTFAQHGSSGGGWLNE